MPVKLLKDKAFYPKRTLNIKGHLMDLSGPKLMGILNLTPDSFYDGGKFDTVDTILDHVE